MRGFRARLLCVLLSLFGAAGSVLAAQAPIDMALGNITTLVRPGEVGYAAFWDGNAYIQCHRTAEQALRCEAAGTLMQPSLRHILTPERQARLQVLGWTLDNRFGNYARAFAKDLPVGRVADEIRQTFAEAYGAVATDLETKTEWVQDVPCPPRHGPTQNLAGLVSDAPSMRPTAITDCAYRGDDPAVEVTASKADLIALYGAGVTAEIQRLRVNVDSDAYVIFATGIGYVQCAPETMTPSIYCEAQSAESWPALAAILTPERVARLHEAGFSDPGRAPNYWRIYPLDQYSDAAIAGEALGVLHDVYGYAGATRLEVNAH